MNTEKKPSVAIAIAIIGALALIAVPVVSRLVDIYLPTPIPTTLIQPTQIVLLPTQESPQIPQVATVVVIPTSQPSPMPTNTSFIPAEILPEGVNNVSEMPNWLAANVGGIPNQWQRVQNGKWKFRAGNAGGVGDNQILSPKVGYLVFGADSGQKDSNGGVIWKDVSIGLGESTFWRCDEPNKPGTIDAADWVLFNPNIGTSCN